MVGQVWHDDDEEVEVKENMERRITEEVLDKIYQITDDILETLKKRGSLLISSIGVDEYEAEKLFLEAIENAERAYDIPIVCDEISLERKGPFYVNRGNCYAIVGKGDKERIYAFVVNATQDDDNPDIVFVKDVYIDMPDKTPDGEERFFDRLREEVSTSMILNAMMFKPELIKSFLDTFFYDPGDEYAYIMSNEPLVMHIIMLLSALDVMRKTGLTPEEIMNMPKEEILELLGKYLPDDLKVHAFHSPNFTMLKLPKEFVEEAVGEKGVKYLFIDFQNMPPLIVATTKHDMMNLLDKDIRQRKERMAETLKTNYLARKFFEDLGLL